MKNVLKSITIAALAASTLSMILPAQAQGLSIQFSAGQPEFQHRGNDYYYRGHRGYRTPRPGYRLYNGYYFPPQAFVGAIINGIGREIQRDQRQDRRYDRGDSRQWARHVEYCYDRYRSYRESDNTFQPYHGPRQECRSPYYG